MLVIWLRDEYVWVLLFGCLLVFCANATGLSQSQTSVAEAVQAQVVEMVSACMELG
jgi:hypothetical protein